jgi:hypothetical protein
MCGIMGETGLTIQGVGGKYLGQSPGFLIESLQKHFIVT